MVDADGQGRIRVEVARAGGTDGAAALSYRTWNGRARAGRAYRHTQGELRWEHRDESTRTIWINLLPGAALRPADFELEFESMTGGTQAPAPLQFAIGPGGWPPNPAGAIEFTADAFVGREGEDLVVVVERRGGADGEVQVEFTTAPRSANDADFSATSALLSWSDGDSGPREITVPLRVDAKIENSELLDVRLSGLIGGADLPAPRAVGVIQDRTGGNVCREDAGALCLAEGRFRVEVEWESPHDGRRGRGMLQRLSDETGIATFFSPGNVELVFKLLDGRELNAHHWVFYGALSDVEYWLTVTDTWQDRVVVYRNPPGEICGRGDNRAFSEEPESKTSFEASIRPEHWLGPDTTSLTATADTCASGSLCLQGGRFEVTATWRAPDGRTGVGTPIEGTDETGYMWFFSPGNIELAVKLLDGTALNDAFWVFAAGLTDIDYRLTVIDREAGVTRSYANPRRPFCGLGDTSAFLK